MSKLITKNLRLSNVDNFIESFAEPNYNLYYYFLANPRPYASDNAPPTLYDNPKNTEIDVYDNMICGRRVTADDVVRMVQRRDWVTGTVYTPYSHDRTNLYSSNFYVVYPENGSYHIFKCLNNNGGLPSTTPPLFSQTSADDDFYFTSDGYQWKYMYSITSTQFSKFATSSYIPVFVNANVVGNAVSGSIDSILVTNKGNNYSSYCSGTFQAINIGGNPAIFSIDPSTASSNNGFYINSVLKITSGPGSGQQRPILGYTVSGQTRNVIIDNNTLFDPQPSTLSSYEITPLVQIVGDGFGASARAVVNTSSNTIQRIEVTDRGEGYTYATVVITGNTGVINVSSGLYNTTTATGKAIISPKGGHGSDAANELASTFVGISAQFDSTSSGGKVFDVNDFRVVGVLKDPLFANVELTIDNSIVPTGSFSDGEIVYQSQGSPIADIVVINPGSGYKSNATVTITGSSSVNAVANATSNSSGRISIINIGNNGEGYITPTVAISPPAAQTFNANTSVSNTENFISIAGNVFQNNDVVTYIAAAGNTALTNLANNTTYYIVQANSSGVKLSGTLNGSEIDLTSGITETGHSIRGSTAVAVAVPDFQKTTSAYGVVTSANDTIVKLTNVYGIFVTGNSSASILGGNTSGHTAICQSVVQPSTYFDQTFKVIGTMESNEFQEDELLQQPSTTGNGYFYTQSGSGADPRTVRLVNKRGTINQSDLETDYTLEGVVSSAILTVSGTVGPDLVHGTGDVIYIENFSPVEKIPGQTETIKLILKF